ncbi:hypothetical protein A9498_31040 (plasmid) [Bacillus thuringiensis serovar coreanensis]|nr:hypothetical protein A9498_31040 [Bacillus thuringiensis serovar coreanensis]
MSYKDWMGMCADGTVLESSSSSVRDAVITGTAIVSTLVGISFPIAGAAIGILSSILPFCGRRMQEHLGLSKHNLHGIN